MKNLITYLDDYFDENYDEEHLLSKKIKNKISIAKCKDIEESASNTKQKHTMKRKHKNYK